MFERMKRGWALTKASLGVLRMDKELLWLPIVSGLLLLVVTASILGGGVLGYEALGLDQLDEGSLQVVGLAYTFLLYLVTYFIIIFFNAAIVAAADVRFQGGDPTLRDGLRAAWQRKGRILQWSAVAATVGMIIRALRQRFKGPVDQLILGGVGLAWNVATYFVVPVLVFEDLGPLEAIRRSGETVKEAWGEALGGEVSAGLVFLVAAIAWVGLTVGLLVTVGGASTAVAGVLLGLLVLGLVVLGAGKAAVDGILVAGLYRYARTGEVPEALEGAPLPPRQGPGAEPSAPA